jgi:hypothetical protein
MGSAQGATGDGAMAGGAQGAQGVAQSDPKKIVGYLQGQGAASAKAVKAAEDATGEEQPAMKALAVINDAYKHGGPEAAWPIMQSYRQQHDLQNTLAIVKLQQGNVAAAAQAMTEADKNVLDGTQTHFSPTVGGQGITATTTKLGNDQPFQHIKMGLKQAWDFVNKLYDQKMDESTAVTLQKIAKSPAGAGGLPGIGDGPLPAGQPAQAQDGGDKTPVPDMSGFDPATAGGPGNARTGNEGPTPPLQVPGGFGRAGAAANTALAGGQPAASGEPGPDAGTETSTPERNPSMEGTPGTPGQTQNTPPNKPGYPGAVEGSRLREFNPRTAAADRRYAELERLYGPDNVSAAYQQFPAGMGADVKGRAAFLNAQKATGVEQESKEKIAANAHAASLEAAKLHYGPEGSVDRTNTSREMTTAARVQGKIQEVLTRNQGTAANTQSNDLAKEIVSARNANPHITEDQIDAIIMRRGQNPRLYEPKTISTGGVNSGVQTPGAQVAAPTYPTPTPAAIAALKGKPEMASHYDAMFGPGASAKVLGRQ